MLFMVIQRKLKLDIKSRINMGSKNNEQRGSLHTPKTLLKKKTSSTREKLLEGASPSKESQILPEWSYSTFISYYVLHSLKTTSTNSSRIELYVFVTT